MNPSLLTPKALSSAPRIPARWARSTQTEAQGGQGLAWCHPASHFGAVGLRTEAPIYLPSPQAFLLPDLYTSGCCQLAQEEVVQATHPRSKILLLASECPAFWLLTFCLLSLKKKKKIIFNHTNNSRLTPPCRKLNILFMKLKSLFLAAPCPRSFPSVR